MTTIADEVVEYYDHRHTDYRLAWGVDRNQAIHYGYYEAGVRGRHAARENTNRVLARELALKPDELVVDAGCGVGGASVWLAEHTAARFLAVNIQPMHLEIAERLVAKRQLAERVRLAQADYCALPLADGVADAVFSLEGVAHAPDKARFIAEAARVLKPGGRLVIFDYFGRAEPLARRDQRDLDRFMRGWALPNLPDWVVFADAARRAGFSDLRFRDATDNVLEDSRHMRLICALVLPFTFLWDRRGERARRVRSNRVSGWLQYRLFRERILTYGVLRRRAPAD